MRTEGAKYTYDKRGRRTVKLALGGVGADGGTGGGSGTGGAAGASGAAGEGRATEYVWDGRDRLREVRLPDGRRVAYGYDALGRRVRKRAETKCRGAPVTTVLCIER